MCKSLGANLIELESKEEYVDVITYILAEQTVRGKRIIYSLILFWSIEIENQRYRTVYLQKVS
jgi:hypothetical protein